MTFDIAIIGGGIVGLGTALALSERTSARLVVLEAENELAQHQTGHNSGVIHSGLYYKPGSLKAQNCADGRELMYRFCAENGIAHDRCGKIVVATSAKELPALAELERRGIANGLKGTRRLSTEELHEHEPHVAGIAGLFVPETGIVDYRQVSETYGQKIRNWGGDVRLQAKFLGCRQSGPEFHLTTSQGDVTARSIINCAGLQSDRVARLCGVDPKLQIVPFRGEYYDLVPNAWSLVKNLIYPVPDPRFPFLGVHFTRMIHGGVEAGPNAVLAFKREGYTRSSFRTRDVMQMLGYRGFWKMAGKYYEMGISEMYRSFSKRAFLKALQRLIPELKWQDIRPAGAGVRAQAVDPDGKTVDDFRIIEAERMIHVLNAPSPAATASLSIGRTIAAMAAKNFGLQPRAERLSA
ncbi:MAG: L-2-hydroxyglutarate oxidase [Gemmataceae bacterium]|nr:L-2-hydroxyglutarate oxidase [Gemmataceae bacterium]